jgi:hypothetical protein
VVLDLVGGLYSGTRAQDFPRALAIEAQQALRELVEHVLDLVPGQAVLHGAQDARVFGPGDVLADQQFFEQLFGRAQAGETDFDVAVRIAARRARVAGELDHALGKIRDAHRAAHVEHEHVAARPIDPGLDDELCGLGEWS